MLFFSNISETMHSKTLQTLRSGPSDVQPWTFLLAEDDIAGAYTCHRPGIYICGTSGRTKVCGTQRPRSNQAKTATNRDKRHSLLDNPDRIVLLLKQLS